MIISDTYTIEQIESEYGIADLELTPKEADLLLQSPMDQIANKYKIFLTNEASGGCIAFGEYDRGWVINPSSRWLIAELTRITLNGTQTINKTPLGFGSIVELKKQITQGAAVFEPGDKLAVAQYSHKYFVKLNTFGSMKKISDLIIVRYQDIEETLKYDGQTIWNKRRAHQS